MPVHIFQANILFAGSGMRSTIKLIHGCALLQNLQNIIDIVLLQDRARDSYYMNELGQQDLGNDIEVTSLLHNIDDFLLEPHSDTLPNCQTLRGG